MADSVDSGPFMLTTSDNPYDPFTEWNEWFQFDESHGYHTCSLLARLTITSDELSDVDRDSAIQSAIDQIVEDNISGKHVKVSRSNVNSVRN